MTPDANDWSLAAEGEIVFGVNGDGSFGYWDVTSIAVSGQIRDVVGDTASDDPHAWVVQAGGESGPPALFDLQLTFGDPERPESECVLKAYARQ